MRSPFLTVCVTLLSCGAAVADTSEFPAEKLRKALEQSKELRVSGEPLGKAVETLSQQTGIPFQLDPALSNLVSFSPQYPTLSFRAARQKVAAVLDRELAPHGLAHVIVGDKVVITTAERAAHLALRQKVGVDLKEVSLARALDRLARETAVNIVLDPQAAKEGETALTLRFGGVTLEVAVRMLAASAGLHSVRLDNALFVTKTAKAQALSADAAELRAPLPPVNLPVQGGAIGLLGGAGLGGLGALGAFGGGAGQFGVGGGALGVMGGGQFGLGGGAGVAGGAGIMGGGGPAQPPKKAPDAEKNQGEKTGRAQGARKGLPGTLVAARGAAPLAEAPARRMAEQVRTAGAGSGNLKTLLDTLSIPRDPAGRPTSFDEQGDPSLTLGIMLRTLQDKFSRPGDNPPFYLTFEFDKQALKAEGFKKDPEGLGLGTDKNKIPAAKNITLSIYLRKILDRVEGGPSSGLTFVIRNDWVEITTNRHVRKECYGRRSRAELEGPLPPLVHAILDARPLEGALRELSEAAGGYNVVIKGELKEAKVPVTATFRNAPLDTAVEILADMAGLVVVRKDNVLYVSSREGAGPRGRQGAPSADPPEKWQERK